MRTAALLALVVATFACGAEPAPRPASDAASAPDASEAALDAPDPCAGVSCLPGSVCSLGACILAPLDASAPDAATEVGVDAAPDATAADAGSDADVAPEVGEDARPPTEDRLADGGCPEGFAMCVGTTCNNILTSRMWCGDCRALCGSQSECIGGRCVTRSSGVSCGPGQGDCDGIAASGCEADTWTDRANCGGCGRACAVNELRCVDGACIPR